MLLVWSLAITWLTSFIFLLAFDTEVEKFQNFSLSHPRECFHKCAKRYRKESSLCPLGHYVMLKTHHKPAQVHLKGQDSAMRFQRNVIQPFCPRCDSTLQTCKPTTSEVSCLRDPSRGWANSGLRAAGLSMNKCYRRGVDNWKTQYQRIKIKVAKG